MIGTIIFCPGPFMHPHLQHIHLWFQRKADSDGAYPEGPVLPWPDRCPNIYTNSGQIRPKDPQEHKEKLQVPCYSKFSRKEMITSFTWHEMRQFQQPHHYTVCQWGFYPIVKTCKKWVMTLSSSMAMYSVMRDIPDARKVPIERGWVALHLYATCKFSNHLTLEQWAFEYGLPLFWYALYNKLKTWTKRVWHALQKIIDEQPFLTQYERTMYHCERKIKYAIIH